MSEFWSLYEDSQALKARLPELRALDVMKRAERLGACGENFSYVAVWRDLLRLALKHPCQRSGAFVQQLKEQRDRVQAVGADQAVWTLLKSIAQQMKAERLELDSEKVPEDFNQRELVTAFLSDFADVLAELGALDWTGEVPGLFTRGTGLWIRMTQIAFGPLRAEAVGELRKPSFFDAFIAREPVSDPPE